MAHSGLYSVLGFKTQSTLGEFSCVDPHTGSSFLPFMDKYEPTSHIGKLFKLGIKVRNKHDETKAYSVVATFCFSVTFLFVLNKTGAIYFMLIERDSKKKQLHFMS